MDPGFHFLTGLAISKGLTGQYLPGAAVAALIADFGVLPNVFSKVTSAARKSLRQSFDNYVKDTLRGDFHSSFGRAAHRFSHSLLAWLMASLIIWIISKTYWWLFSLCYLSHILIDIFTHEKDYAVRPFYPFSDWKIDGRHWETNKKIFFSFWMGLGTVLVLLYL